MPTWRAGQIITASALQAITQTDVQTYTPTWGNIGTATFNVNTGLYWKTGEIVNVIIYATVNVAGSGSSTVTVTVPSNAHRGTRQIIPFHGETIGGNGTPTTSRGGEVVFLTSGTGAVADRIRVDDADGNGEANLIGSDIVSGTIMSIQGWYREA